MLSTHPPSTPLRRLDSRSNDHYLTTQDVKEGHLIAPPLTALAEELPFRPALLGTLVPQSINMWVGHSREPSSSGLHHDFHDNLCAASVV